MTRSKSSPTLLLLSLVALLFAIPYATWAADQGGPTTPTPPVPSGQAVDPHAPQIPQPGPTPPTPPIGPAAFGKNALYIEQTYTYASLDNAGNRSRDVLQKMYLTKDRIAIVDSSMTVLVDLKNKSVTTIDHQKKTYITESFENIRKRINQRVELQRKNLDAMVPGPQKDEVYKTIKGYLDDNVTYTAEIKEMVEKSLSGAFLDSVTITAQRTWNGKTTNEVVFTAKMSRELKLPFENFNYAEALYYLELASEKMLKEFNGPRALMIPMELKIELPTGGSVTSKVQKFEYRDSFEESLFMPPAEYTSAESKVVPKPHLNPVDLEQ